MATPIESAYRETQAFLRGPVRYNTVRVATAGVVRAGVQYAGLLVAFPTPQDNAVDDFGIQTGGGFTVELADEPDDTDWFLLAEDGSLLLTETGASRLILDY